jgi:hypothetical protein
VITLKSHSEVHGRITDGRLYPERFDGDVLRDGVDYRTRVDYHTDGTVAAATTSSAPEANIPIPAAQTRGTVDQLTAYLMLERQLARADTCALAVPVYDGRLRYDLYFSNAETPNGAAGVGVATACDMHRREIAGFQNGEGRTEGAPSGRIWYERLIPNELMIPVRMRFATELGDVSGQLAELRRNGAALARNN